MQTNETEKKTVFVYIWKEVLEPFNQTIINPVQVLRDTLTYTSNVMGGFIFQKFVKSISII